jgi:hypothetical protein
MRYAAAVLLIVACASDVQGQAVVEGRVLGADSAALVAAQVELVDSSGSAVLDAASDSSGWFRIPFGRRIRPGLFYLTVRYLGYADVDRTPIRVGKSERVILTIRMAPTPVALPPVNVVARRRYRPGPGDEFRDRAYWVKRTGFGHVLEYEELQQLHGASLVRAVSRVPGVTASYVNNAGLTTEVVRMRGGCVPIVYLDRMRMDAFDLSSIDAASLEGIEVYKGAAEVPPEYALGAGDCGVILAWSNQRLDGARALTWKRVGIFGGLVALVFFILN